MSYQVLADGQVSPEVPINENMAALGQVFLWAHNVTADTGLVVGLSGGDFDSNAVANATVTGTDNATNYIVAHRTTRALSVATGTTNWNNTTTYGRVARAVFASGVLTFHDERYSAGGIFDHAAAGSGSLAASSVTVADAGSYYAGTDAEAVLQEIGATLATLSGTTDVDTDQVYTSDTGSTADSDPGNGLFRWNNATQASATALYVDNQTAAGVSLTTFFASLPPDGYIHLAQEDDATKWQLWKWSGLPTPASGYYKFTGLVLMASGGSLVDNKSAAVSFKGTPPATQPIVVVPFFPGVPTASQLLGVFPAPAGIGTITFAAALAGAAGKALTAATAQTDIDVRKNATTSAGGASVGTIRFAAAGTVPTFIAASGFTLTGGTDYLTLWAPVTPDATLANFAISLYATR
jgi:hypothetical protein